MVHFVNYAPRQSVFLLEACRIFTMGGNRVGLTYIVVLLIAKHIDGVVNIIGTICRRAGVLAAVFFTHLDGFAMNFS